MPLAAPPGIDVGAVLAAWVERTRADSRFAGWEVTFKGVGTWPESCACIEVIGPDVVATLAAWPTGCVDLDALRCSDEHLVQRHDEVPTVEALLGVLAAFAGTVLNLAPGMRS